MTDPNDIAKELNQLFLDYIIKSSKNVDIENSLEDNIDNLYDHYAYVASKYITLCQQYAIEKFGYPNEDKEFINHWTVICTFIYIMGKVDTIITKKDRDDENKCMQELADCKTILLNSYSEGDIKPLLQLVDYFKTELKKN